MLGFGEPGGEVQGTERMLSRPRSAWPRAHGRSSDDWAWFELGPPALAVARRIVLGVRPYPAAGMPLGAKALAATYEPAPRQAPDGAGDVAIAPGAAILAAAFGLAALAALAVRRPARGVNGRGRGYSRTTRYVPAASNTIPTTFSADTG